MGSHTGAARTNGFILSDFLFDGEGEADSMSGTIMNMEVIKYTEGRGHRGMKALEELYFKDCGIAIGIIIGVCINSTAPGTHEARSIEALPRKPTAPKGAS